jgi:hypothetical protein
MQVGQVKKKHIGGQKVTQALVVMNTQRCRVR